jgi:hypothetical protein
MLLGGNHTCRDHPFTYSASQTKWQISTSLISIARVSWPKQVSSLYWFPGYYLMELVERMPRVCKAVIKAKGGYFEEFKIYIFICLTLSWSLHDSICVSSCSFDVFTIFLQCRKQSNKEKPLNE